MEVLGWLAAAAAYVVILVVEQDGLAHWYCARLVPALGALKDSQSFFWAPFTAVAAWLSLVITKEQKTSKFRQAWIDKLRDEMAAFVATTAALLQRLLDGQTPEQFYDKHADFMTRVSLIRLRLNPDEPHSQHVLAHVSDVRDMLNDIHGGVDVDRPAKADALRRKLDDLLASSNDLLKLEWQRVKRGEPIFVATGRIALFVFIAFGFPIAIVLATTPACHGA